MAYEVLVLDVDGTLVNSKKEITKATKEAVIQCQQNGIKVVIASGRCTEGIRHQQLCYRRGCVRYYPSFWHDP